MVSKTVVRKLSCAADGITNQYNFFLKGHLIKLIKTLSYVHIIGLSNFTSRTFYPKEIIGQAHRDLSTRTRIAAVCVLYPSTTRDLVSASV